MRLNCKLATIYCESSDRRNRSSAMSTTSFRKTLMTKSQGYRFVASSRRPPSKLGDIQPERWLAENLETQGRGGPQAVSALDFRPRGALEGRFGRAAGVAEISLRGMNPRGTRFVLGLGGRGRALRSRFARPRRRSGRGGDVSRAPLRLQGAARCSVLPRPKGVPDERLARLSRQLLERRVGGFPGVAACGWVVFLD